MNRNISYTFYQISCEDAVGRIFLTAFSFTAAIEYVNGTVILWTWCYLQRAARHLTLSGALCVWRMGRGRQQRRRVLQTFYEMSTSSELQATCSRLHRGELISLSSSTTEEKPQTFANWRFLHVCCMKWGEKNKVLNVIPFFHSSFSIVKFWHTLSVLGCILNFCKPLKL